MVFCLINIPPVDSILHTKIPIYCKYFVNIILQKDEYFFYLLPYFKLKKGNLLFTIWTQNSQKRSFFGYLLCIILIKWSSFPSFDLPNTIFIKPFTWLLYLKYELFIIFFPLKFTFCHLHFEHILVFQKFNFETPFVKSKVVHFDYLLNGKRYTKRWSFRSFIFL